MCKETDQVQNDRFCSFLEFINLCQPDLGSVGCQPKDLQVINDKQLIAID